jgi:endonuclease/exonuclease/phosphatase family metal-dependent hydrolase
MRELPLTGRPIHWLLPALVATMLACSNPASGPGDVLDDASAQPDIADLSDTGTDADADADADTDGTAPDEPDAGDAPTDVVDTSREDPAPDDTGSDDASAGDAEAGDGGAGDGGAGDAGAGDTDAGDLGGDTGGVTTARLRIVAANLSSGNFQRYEAPGIRILQGLDADLVLIQEFSYVNEPVFEFGDLRGFVAGTFGEEFSYYVGAGNLPNGIVSRYPILEAGTWDDVTLSNRGFDYARIDIPGSRDLWAVSVHLKASRGAAAQRNAQAVALVGFVVAHVPDEDYLVIGGDLNTWSRAEASLDTLSAVVVTSAPWPADGAGEGDTNADRTRPYDWVLPDVDLVEHQVPVGIGAQSFASGLVVDTRVYAPLSDLAPALVGDSGATGMQHMAVVRDFELTCTPAAATVCVDDTTYWRDDCGILDALVSLCECGCARAGGGCRPCACAEDTCHGAGECSVVEGTAACACAPGCVGEYCERCGVASQPIGVNAFACVVERGGTLGCWGRNWWGEALPPGGSGFTNVATGGASACALDEAGWIVCWGREDESPPGGPGYVELALGYGHGCARHGDGTVACWGANGSGQATPPPGAAGSVALTAGYSHTCALDGEGALVCWGSPGSVAGTPEGTGFAGVAAGTLWSCALDDTGAIHCWGSQASAAGPPPVGGGFTELALGNGFGLALDTNGSVRCWGGACPAVPAELVGLSHLVSGGSVGCALTAQGAPRCWGAEPYGTESVPPTAGAYGLAAGPDNVCTRSPVGALTCLGSDTFGVRSPPEGDGFGVFGVGQRHACALTAEDGEIICWGSDEEDGRTTPPEGTGFQELAVGHTHACAIGEDAGVTCWGDSLDGGTNAPDDEFQAVSAGRNVSCGLRVDTSLVCWGSSSQGALDVPPGTGFRQIATRGATSCALRVDGSLACWGARTTTPPPEGAFAQVAPGALTCGYVGTDYVCEQFSCGLRVDGTLDCWGTLGQRRLAPPAGANFTHLSAGAGFVCALDEDGVVQCWGDVVRPPELDVPRHGSSTGERSW